jgi:Putative Actinobacterial Holin-X, holin superfamily III
MSGTSTQPRSAQPEAVPDGHRSATPATTSPPSTADLIRRATDQLSTLVRDEIALARAEMTEKLTHAGKGAGLFGGAGVVSLYGVFGLLAGAVLLLAKVIPAWGAALAVGGALLLLAGIMALMGRGQVKKASPPVPEAAVQGVRTDIETVAAAVEDRGHHR